MIYLMLVWKCCWTTSWVAGNVRHWCDVFYVILEGIFPPVSEECPGNHEKANICTVSSFKSVTKYRWKKNIPLTCWPLVMPYHETYSIWVQVMACCLMASSHYLNQCWLGLDSIELLAIPWEILKISIPKYAWKSDILNYNHIIQGPMS